MKKKVVLVQDNPEILEIMDQVLDEAGFEVIGSLTTEPIENVEEIDPDVVVVDDHIKGDVKGSEVIKELKSDPDTEEIPAVLTSTSSSIKQDARDCKADDYIEKPFGIDEMIDVVKRNAD
ncbi:response regulator [Chryseobacterium wangxinyae]|uniref:response regulator n=1 Tax=Chryseobacterium sp. CY350 TaxID=2997336 RepID=UPI002270B551|nr:response regulator [Chryseobacterium sp. CY350]MCY0976781.1 response regulator [Chryseobacterium sp. CY350]WBZ96782.1 response regulator [Chryseobacterium sp. CY350]